MTKRIVPEGRGWQQLHVFDPTRMEAAWAQACAALQGLDIYAPRGGACVAVTDGGCLWSCWFAPGILRRDDLPGFRLGLDLTELCLMLEDRGSSERLALSLAGHTTREALAWLGPLLEERRGVPLREFFHVPSGRPSPPWAGSGHGVGQGKPFTLDRGALAELGRRLANADLLLRQVGESARDWVDDGVVLRQDSGTFVNTHSLSVAVTLRCARPITRGVDFIYDEDLARVLLEFSPGRGEHHDEPAFHCRWQESEMAGLTLHDVAELHLSKVSAATSPQAQQECAAGWLKAMVVQAMELAVGRGSSGSGKGA